ncbi:hypothetical protein F5B20DRAFT_294476 [Whalleya microplaca]|nr:hypothetical protein F5B20DRAFT_294476 [Whalleya microplaca]
MGWLWATPPAPKGPNPSASTNADSNKPTPSASTNPDANKPTPSPAKPTPPPAKPTKSDYDDPALAEFMAELQGIFSPKPSDTASPNTSTPSQNPTTDKASPAYRLDPVAESLLPTTMSCQQAFDHAYGCNSLSGQFIAVYREGAMRTCSEHWEAFWFCMRTRAYSGTAKADAIRAHYRARDVAKYRAPGRRSSEDVWEPRRERLQPGEAFSEPYEHPDLDDEEWRRFEIEHRRRVQEMLRAEEERERRGGAGAGAEAEAGGASNAID